MEYDISVILITYEQDFSIIGPTLESLILQSCLNYQIVITDDASKNFPLNEIINLFDHHGFTDYLILQADKNQGIVGNILAGMRAAAGTFVKVISPGDLLYSENTLDSILSFSQNNQIKAGFGKVVAYWGEGDSFEISQFNAPSNPTDYLAPIDQKAITQSLLFADWIPGCSTFFDRMFAIDQYEILQRRYNVNFSEDLVMALIALEGTPILLLNENILWYDRNNGISSSGRKDSVARLYEDHDRFFTGLVSEFPNLTLLKKALKRFNLRKSLSTSCIYGLLRSVRERSYRNPVSQDKNTEISQNLRFLENCFAIDAQ